MVHQRQEKKRANRLEQKTAARKAPSPNMDTSQRFLISSHSKPESYSSSFRLFKGAEATLVQGYPTQNASMDYEIHKGPLCFWYCLAGKVSNSFNPSKGRNTNIALKQTQCALSWLGNAGGSLMAMPEEELRTLSLHLEIKDLARFVGEEDANSLPSPVSDVLGLNKAKAFALGTERTPEMNAVLHQILFCPLAGKLKKRYLESKAMELLCLHLAHLSRVYANQGKIKLSKSDLERIHAARDLILTRLQDPPGLVELAHMVGINDFKLKQGFRQTFGQTVFGLLHEERMQNARLLLLEGGVNVSQAAGIVGYTNVSHFITAFRKHFGATPGAYLKSLNQGLYDNRCQKS